LENVQNSVLYFKPGDKLKYIEVESSTSTIVYIVDGPLSRLELERKINELAQGNQVREAS